MATIEDLGKRSVRDPETGCLRWTGAHTAKGYGHIFIDGKARPVHRVAYENAFGDIPEGLEIDHVFERGCRHRDCIEPLHLEAVTHSENVRRQLATITHCPHGHEYTIENTVVGGGGRGRTGRRCRTCKNQRHAEWKRKNRKATQEKAGRSE